MLKNEISKKRNLKLINKLSFYGIIFEPKVQTKIMKLILTFTLVYLFFSCVPLSIAPTIQDDQVILAKKFKKKLPNQYALVFEDPKEANEFYNYINTKYELNHINVEYNVPFNIDGETLYFSFFEVEKTTKTINLVPIMVDAKRENNGNDPLLEDFHMSRSGKWYLLLTASDDDFKDCLNPNHPKYHQTLKFLKGLKTEYLNTTNYLDVLLRKK